MVAAVLPHSISAVQTPNERRSEQSLPEATGGEQLVGGCSSSAPFSQPGYPGGPSQHIQDSFSRGLDAPEWITERTTPGQGTRYAAHDVGVRHCSARATALIPTSGARGAG